MGATIDALLQLQKIESKLRSVREQIAAKRRTVQARQGRVAKLEKDIAEIHLTIRQAQAEADRSELDRKTREEHIAKLREALNRTKTNKEYASILTQLNTEKADALKIEDNVLAGMGRVDEARKREQTTRELLDKEKAQVQELVRSAREGEEQLAEEQAELERQRAEAAAQLSPSVLAVFERACDRHEGEAMAMLEKVHPKRAEYVCSGCNMSIPLEIINSLQSKDEVRLCQTCSRILHLEPASGVPA